MKKEAEQSWLENGQYQAILQLTNTIAFEFDLQKGTHFVSPFISETLAGNYDERQLSQIMLEDGVLHPDDTPKMMAFRDRILAGGGGNETILMRLKTRKGVFRWYRMSVCINFEVGRSTPMVVGTLTDADEEIQLREKQAKQAKYDDVTDIFNKMAFFAETKRLLHTYSEQSYSLILFDVDRFKMVNDLFGIREGDQLLRFIGKSAAACVKECEAYGRIRDDVFCLCVCRTDEEIVKLVEELWAAVCAFPLSFNLTFSAGIYPVENTGIPVSIMVDRASLALRTVKGNAVSSFAFYRPQMGQTLALEQKILGEMQNGIRNGEFHVYYQPKHRISDGRTIGSEALVRWFHPEKGLIPPAEFIGLFERNGLITRLDEYVWETVCQNLRSWLDRGLTPQPVSVNVSRIHLYDPNLCDKFIGLTEKYQIPTGLLEIELTESAYVENPRLGELMEALQEKGFTFSMDDFGSGYSSLNMLRSIPVDVLKLDLRFLDFTEEEQSGKIIMESIILMARRLKIPVIAEGVETAGQADFLQNVGCTMAQGFYYSRPMPLEDYERLYL